MPPSRELTAERRTLLLQFMREGGSQMDWAQKLGVHRSTIQRDLKALFQELYEQLDYRSFVGGMLARQQLIEAEAREAWLESKGEIVTTKVKKDENGNIIETITETKQSAGDSVFLRAQLAVIDQMTKILDLDIETPANFKLPALEDELARDAAGVIVFIPDNERTPVNGKDRDSSAS